MSKKTLVLWDLENLYMMPIVKYDMKPTNKGIKHFLNVLQTKGTFEKNDIIVAAIWEKYPKEKMFLRTHNINTIDVMGEGKNIADGYLITEGLILFNERKDEFEQVILIGGDGVYFSLLSTFLQHEKDVILYGWEDVKGNENINKTYYQLKKSNENFTIEPLEKVFEFEKGVEKLIEEGYFEGDVTTEDERNIINYVFYNQERKEREIIKNGLAGLFGKNKEFVARYPSRKSFKAGEQLINSCIDQGIFTEYKKYDEDKKMNDNYIKLDLTHKKVVKTLKK